MGFCGEHGKVPRRKKQYWIIEGYDGLKPLFREKIAFGSLPGGRIESVLQTLAAKHLTPSEIIGAHAKRKTKRANELLAVRREPGLPAYMCGDSPHYTAVIEDFDYDKAREIIKAFNAQPFSRDR